MAGRKPVHLTANAKRPEGRQTMWEAMRKLRRFTISELETSTRLKEGALRSYVEALTKAGYLQRERPTERVNGAFPRATWSLVRDTGVEAPRVRKDGSQVTHGYGREQLWRTMRIIGDFNHHELALQASTEEHPVAVQEAAFYCQYLARAGYLVVTAEGGPNRATRFRLLPSRYSGPRAPQIQRIRQVWDANKQAVVWRPEDGGDE